MKTYKERLYIQPGSAIELVLGPVSKMFVQFDLNLLEYKAHEATIEADENLAFILLKYGSLAELIAIEFKKNALQIGFMSHSGKSVNQLIDDLRLKVDRY